MKLKVKIYLAVFAVFLFYMESVGVNRILLMDRDTVWNAEAKWIDARNLELKFASAASKDIHSTERFRIEPVYIEDDSFFVEFPSLLYLTGKGKKFFLRRQSCGNSAVQFAVHDILVRNSSLNDSMYYYIDTLKIGGGYGSKGEIRFRYWMEDCCSEYLLDSTSIQVAMLPLPVYMADTIADTVQNTKDSPVEEHRKQFELYIKYPVDKSEVYSEYMDNENVLYQLHAKAKDILTDDSHYKLKRIVIEGYASPEGRYERNVDLSVMRAKAFASYLAHIYGINPDIIRTIGAAENWQGLYEEVKSDSMVPYRNEVMELLCPYGTELVQPCKEELERLHKGKAYEYLLKNIYPHLRKIKMNIYYVKEID